MKKGILIPLILILSISWVLAEDNSLTYKDNMGEQTVDNQIIEIQGVVNQQETVTTRLDVAASGTITNSKEYEITLNSNSKSVILNSKSYKNLPPNTKILSTLDESGNAQISITLPAGTTRGNKIQTENGDLLVTGDLKQPLEFGENTYNLPEGVSFLLGEDKGVKGPATVTYENLGDDLFLLRASIKNDPGKELGSFVVYDKYRFIPPANPKSQNNIDIFLSNLNPSSLETTILETEDLGNSWGYLSIGEDDSIVRQYTSGHITAEGLYKGNTYTHNTVDFDSSKSQRLVPKLTFAYTPSAENLKGEGKPKVFETTIEELSFDNYKERPSLVFSSGSKKAYLLYDSQNARIAFPESNKGDFILEDPVGFRVSQEYQQSKRSAEFTLGSGNSMAVLGDNFQLGGLLVSKQISDRTNKQQVKYEETVEYTVTQASYFSNKPGSVEKIKSIVSNSKQTPSISLADKREVMKPVKGLISGGRLAYINKRMNDLTKIKESLEARNRANVDAEKLRGVISELTDLETELSSVKRSGKAYVNWVTQESGNAFKKEDFPQWVFQE